jgi:DNA-binding transcriptional LysR family regulator
VLQTRSVTVAGAQLGLTQSAVSNALNRLRSTLGDQLFVRTSEGMMPTPRAEEIAGPFRESIDRIRQAMGQHPEFDPATSDRRFRIFMADSGQMTLMPKVLESIAVEAPNVIIETVSATNFRNREEAMSNGDVSLAVGYFKDFQGSFHCQSLFKEDYVCMVGAANTMVTDEVLSFEQFAALPHMVYMPSGGGHMQQEQAIERAFAAHGLKRKVTFRAAHFLGVTRIIASTNLLITLPYRLAQACATLTPVRMFEPPLEIPGFEVAQFWHSRFHHDPGNRWLRRLFAHHHAAMALFDNASLDREHAASGSRLSFPEETATTIAPELMAM